MDPGEGVEHELPVHTVMISAFYMDKTEVAKATWDEVYTWATNHRYSIDSGVNVAANHPARMVSWYDCVKWCNARSEKEGRTPCYTVGGNVYKSGKCAPDCNWSANGYRLPTEAEWEKAARGGLNGRRFPWNDLNITHTNACYDSSPCYAYDTSVTRRFHPAFNGTYPYTIPVGYFANGYGVYDMAGNVQEWCWDWYDDTYYANSPGSDPRGPASGTYRVLRGGGSGDLALFCRVAYRSGALPDYTEHVGFGFRCVRGL
jgi:formylglycine-generating enzyme required for sulfatase activity